MPATVVCTAAVAKEATMTAYDTFLNSLSSWRVCAEASGDTSSPRDQFPPVQQQEEQRDQHHGEIEDQRAGRLEGRGDCGGGARSLLDDVFLRELPEIAQALERVARVSVERRGQLVHQARDTLAADRVLDEAHAVGGLLDYHR